MGLYELSTLCRPQDSGLYGGSLHGWMPTRCPGTTLSYLVWHGLLATGSSRLVQAGKASFSYAWVMDEQEEERSRGVTIDVGMKVCP